MESTTKPYLVNTTPKPRVYLEKIGDTSWELQEAQLDAFNDVRLWHENPRLLPHLPSGGFATEEELEAALRLTRGYDNLKKSIEEIGQMEPVYAWREDESTEKYVVFEGATRISILRELSRKHADGPKAGKFNRVKVKVLPPHFGEKERVILLARIHVRGSGVRSWGRYIEAKFIHDHVTGEKALMSVTDMANHMEKSVSWVMRLRDAYQFALQFVQYVDDGTNGEQLAAREFSTLEEISKAPSIGSLLRDYKDKSHDALRADVFEMVRNEVFKEYRDARFLKQFHDDPEKWALLKTGEKHIASRLAAEVKHSGSSLKAKIAALEPAVDRALQRDDHDLNDDDVDHLRNAMSRIQQHVHGGVDRFRLELKSVTKLFSNATLADVKALPADELAEFKQSLEYFDMLVQKYGNAT